VCAPSAWCPRSQRGSHARGALGVVGGGTARSLTVASQQRRKPATVLEPARRQQHGDRTDLISSGTGISMA
jgi:hypothetical protein